MDKTRGCQAGRGEAPFGAVRRVVACALGLTAGCFGAEAEELIVRTAKTAHSANGKGPGYIRAWRRDGRARKEMLDTND